MISPRPGFGVFLVFPLPEFVGELGTEKEFGGVLEHVDQVVLEFFVIQEHLTKSLQHANAAFKQGVAVTLELVADGCDGVDVLFERERFRGVEGADEVDFLLPVGRVVGIEIR